MKAIIILLASMASALPSEEKQPRSFSIFSVVAFPNNECTTQMNGMKGVCLTEEECASRTGGSASGNCASGFGVCCFTMINTGGSTITTNVTYIQNTEFPAANTPAAGSAAQNFNFMLNGGSNIKSIRLDFDAFQFDQPAATGICTNDVVGLVQGSGLFTGVNSELCGTSTGQHVYLDHGSNGGAAINIGYNLNAVNTNGRTWKILVRYLEDGNPSLPTQGCLQWFTGTSGVIKSFNAENGANVGMLLANTDYKACIRMEKGMNCVAYTEARPQGQAPDAFNLHSANANNARQNAECLQNAIVIDSTTAAGTAETSFCGDVLSTVAQDTIGSTVYSKAPDAGFRVLTDNNNKDNPSSFEIRFAQSKSASCGS